jgi:hypothetical protein
MLNWKEVIRKRSWPNFKILSWQSPGGLRKNTENVSQDSRSAGRDLNQGPPEYEAGMLTTQPRHHYQNIATHASYRYIFSHPYFQMLKENENENRAC